jgi:hypothetical protein
MRARGQASPLFDRRFAAPFYYQKALSLPLVSVILTVSSLTES